MEKNLIAEALKFMVLGMGVVFIFLIVMIYALKLQAKIIGSIFQRKVRQYLQSLQELQGLKNRTKLQR
ncbi:MAG: OadG family protein [Halarcobacter ebronensis]